MSFRFVYEAVRDFPRKSLGTSHFFDADGGPCCALGVAAFARAASGRWDEKALPELGLTAPEARAVVAMNDGCGGTDAERYAFVLRWLAEQVAREDEAAR